MKWYRWVVLGVVLIFLWIGVERPDEYLHVVFCDVGQGDSVLVTKGEFQMVVDGGPSGEKLLSCLGNNLPFWERKIEVVINTHPQKDHLGGLDELVERYEVGRLVINGVYGGGKDGEKLRRLVQERGVEVVTPKKGDTLKISNVYFDILWPEERVGKILAWVDSNETFFDTEKVLGKNTDVNEVSVVTRLRYKEFEVLLTGDIGKGEEKKLLGDERLTEIDVLKVAHHGSRYSSSLEFLDRVSPEVAIIQVGKNRFGHPTDEVLERLSKVGAKVLRNDQDGEIEIVSDGERYWLQ
jgi:competence protein ComEC